MSAALTTEDFLAPSPLPEAEDAVEAYLATPATRAEITNPDIVTERIRAIRQTEEQRADEEAAARRDATIALTEALAALDEVQTHYAEAALNFFPACDALLDADHKYRLAWDDARRAGVDVPVRREPLSMGMR